MDLPVDLKVEPQSKILAKLWQKFLELVQQNYYDEPSKGYNYIASLKVSIKQVSSENT